MFAYDIAEICVLRTDPLHNVQYKKTEYCVPKCVWGGGVTHSFRNVLSPSIYHCY